MTNDWPGEWHSKELQPSQFNDEGILTMIGSSSDAYLFYEPNGNELHNTGP